jgi:hypothetical protein
MGVDYFTSGPGVRNKTVVISHLHLRARTFWLLFLRRGAATSVGYQAVTSPPSKPRKAPTSVSRRSCRFR